MVRGYNYVVDMRAFIDRSVEGVYRLFAFSVPFAVIAIPLGSYYFSLATFFLLVLDILFLLRGRFISTPLASVTLFLAWCLLAAVPRLSVGTYLPSLLALSTMLIPLVVSIPDVIRPQKIIQALIYGLIGSFLLAAYDVLVNVGLPPLTEIFSGVGLWGTEAIQESVYFGIYRAKSAQTEPSHYAHYLAFTYAILDQADRKGMRVPRARLLKTAITFFIFATVSLSGLIMFVGYLGMVGVIEWRQRILKKLFSPNFWALLPFLAFAGLLIAEFYGEGIAKYVSWTFGRLDDAITAVQLGLVQGSEASRARSATIFFEYWASQDWWGALVGEGYGNQEEWLVDNFGHLGGNISFARGSVHNNFAYVGITTGVMGFLLYVFNILVFVKKRYYVPVSIFGIWVLGHFAMGYLTFYRFWWPLILGIVIFKIRRKEEHGG